MRFIAISALVFSTACTQKQAAAPVYPQVDETAELKRRVAALETENHAMKERLTEIEGVVETQTSLLRNAIANNRANQGNRPPAARMPRRRRGPQQGVRYSIAIKDAPYIGSKNAPIVIVKAHEYACPACYHAQSFDKQILAEFGKRVQIVYKDFVVHPTRAWQQAFAVCAANKQGRFKAYQNEVWEKGFKQRRFDQAHYEKLAKDMGLNMRRFVRDRDGVCTKITRSSHAEMQAINVAGTPTYFINGKILNRRSLSEVKRILKEEEALYRKNRGKRRGRNYYRKHVVLDGKKVTRGPLPVVPANVPQNP